MGTEGGGAQLDSLPLSWLFAQPYTGFEVQPLCSITSPASYLTCWQMRHCPIQQSWDRKPP